MFDWSIHIVETGGRLEIHDPPFKPGAAVLALLGLLLATAALLLPIDWMKSYAAADPLAESIVSIAGWIARAALLAPALIFAALGWGLWRSSYRAVFDRAAGTVQLDRNTFGFTKNVTLPLDEISEALVETPRKGRRLILVTEAGRPALVTRTSNRRGHHEAAAAIRGFLQLR